MSLALRRSIAIILLVLVADQALKFYIKTQFYLHESQPLLGDWFYLNFVENPGMAFGLEFGGDAGKLILTAVRLIASVVILLYLQRLLKANAHMGLVLCVSAIFAGAVGNIVDSVFYGMLFGESSGAAFDGPAQFLPAEGGYGTLFFGKVVDMFEFRVYWPHWVPKLGGRQIFPPIFNIADAAISVGVITVIVFQKRFFGKKDEGAEPSEPLGVYGPDTQPTEA